MESDVNVQNTRIGAGARKYNVTVWFDNVYYVLAVWAGFAYQNEEHPAVREMLSHARSVKRIQNSSQWNQVAWGIDEIIKWSERHQHTDMSSSHIETENGCFCGRVEFGIDSYAMVKVSMFDGNIRCDIEWRKALAMNVLCASLPSRMKAGQRITSIVSHDSWGY